MIPTGSIDEVREVRKIGVNRFLNQKFVCTVFSVFKHKKCGKSRLAIKVIHAKYGGLDKKRETDREARPSSGNW